MKEDLELVVAETLEPLALDLVELRLGGIRGRPTIAVHIDRRDGAPVGLNDCAAASRALETRLDAGDWISHRYVLEVSSPGVERPLRHAADWRRFTGRRANVLSPPLGGRVEVEIVGLDGEPGAEVATVRTPTGQEYHIPLAAVKEARLAFHW
jgi:ribosome maturation factor RimP